MSRSIDLILVIAIALSLGACATAPSAESAKFTARGSEPAFVLRMDDEDRIFLTHDGADLSFPSARLSYPRWNGAIYSADTAEHRMELRILRYRPCEVAGVERHRTASVEVSIDGREMQGCGHYH